MPARVANRTRGRRMISTTVSSFKSQGGFSGSGQGMAKCETIKSAFQKDIG